MWASRQTFTPSRQKTSLLRAALLAFSITKILHSASVALIGPVGNYLTEELRRRTGTCTIRQTNVCVTRKASTVLPEEPGTSSSSSSSSLRLQQTPINRLIFSAQTVCVKRSWGFTGSQSLLFKTKNKNRHEENVYNVSIYYFNECFRASKKINLNTFLRKKYHSFLFSLSDSLLLANILLLLWWFIYDGLWLPTAQLTYNNNNNKIIIRRHI